MHFERVYFLGVLCIQLEDDQLTQKQCDGKEETSLALGSAGTAGWCRPGHFRIPANDCGSSQSAILMQRMSIQEVLANMQEDANMGETCVLRFVRGTGKKRGTIKTVAKARYGAPRRVTKGKGKSGSGRSKKHKLHVDAGTIPMTDTERNIYFTPLISHIIQYNNHQVIH